MPIRGTAEPASGKSLAGLFAARREITAVSILPLRHLARLHVLTQAAPTTVKSFKEELVVTCFGISLKLSRISVLCLQRRKASESRCKRWVGIALSLRHNSYHRDLFLRCRPCDCWSSLLSSPLSRKMTVRQAFSTVNP